MLLKLRRVRFELRIGEVVSGEFAIRWLSVSETTHGNAAAKRIDQAKQEQGVLHRYVALAWHRRASGARERRCNSPGRLGAVRKLNLSTRTSASS
jgi:hypothetical protein